MEDPDREPYAVVVNGQPALVSPNLRGLAVRAAVSRLNYAAGNARTEPVVTSSVLKSTYSGRRWLFRLSGQGGYGSSISV
jgi:hypothetical protein